MTEAASSFTWRHAVASQKNVFAIYFLVVTSTFKRRLYGCLWKVGVLGSNVSDLEGSTNSVYMYQTLFNARGVPSSISAHMCKHARMNIRMYWVLTNMIQESWKQESYKMRSHTILCMILNDQGYMVLWWILFVKYKQKINKLKETCP